ncbi:hypothetical protein HF072_10770 [Bacillus sp. RO3]|nr:hypothetical protein [Bacillus sp. RO3]
MDEASPWMEALLHAFTFMPQSLLVMIWLSPFFLYELRSAPPLGLTESILLQLVVLLGGCTCIG